MSHREGRSTAARRGRGRPPGVALLLAVLSAAAAPGQTPAPPQDTGFVEVNVDLDAGRFDRVLPFDEPIRIVGTMPAGATQLGVRYAVGRGALQVVDDPSCRVESARTPGQVIPLQPPEPIAARTSGSSFHVVVPRLPPQRYFVFCFFFDSEVTEEQAAAFQGRAREALDQGLSAVASGNITAAQAKALSQDLQRRLLQVTGADRILAPGSLFDEDQAAVELVEGQLNRFVVQVLIPQLRRRRILAGDEPSAGGEAVPSYRERQLRFRGRLDEVRQDPDLGELVARLNAAAAANANVAAWLEPEYTPALEVARLGDAGAARAAFGQDPAADEPTTLLETLEPQAAGAFADRYRQTQSALAKLRELIGELLAPDPPVALGAGLDAASRARLESLAGDGGVLRLAASDAFSLAGLADDVRRALEDRAAALDALAEQARIVARGVKIADASSTTGYDTFRNIYISADAGLVYAPEIDEVKSYVGANIYFRPVNKDVPLSQAGGFGRRFALTIGLTVQGIDDTDGTGNVKTRDNLFGNQSLLIGGGLRVTDMIRLGAGALVFREQDPSPLIDDLEVAATYYLTLSFDLDVASAFRGGLGQLFGGGG